MEKTIWVLGSKHSSAHKSVSWHSSFPNFADCNILIINLQTLKSEQLQKRHDDFFLKARKYIFDLLMTGENEVIIILSPESEHLEWLPLFPELKETAPIGVREHSAESHITEYMKTVETCPFYIHAFDSYYCRQKTDPKSDYHENYLFTTQARYGYSVGVYVASRIVNKAKQMIGGHVRFLVDYGRNLKNQFASGGLYLLPPPTRCTAEQAIDIILNVLAGGELIESPPPWEAKIDLPGLQDVKNQIVQKETEKEILTKDIGKLKNRKANLIKFRRLLWADGAPLENAVKDAFVTLGFSEIRKIRAKNLEDWVIDFKSVSEYKHGVFEVKGSEKRTCLSDMNQCDKWVKDYLLENNLQVKGIFVSNQYRRGDIRTNLKEREHFEDNELKFARQREICILPSHEIFYAVVEKIKGNPQLARKSIEEKIVASNEICRLSKT